MQGKQDDDGEDAKQYKRSFKAELRDALTVVRLPSLRFCHMLCSSFNATWPQSALCSPQHHSFCVPTGLLLV